MFKDITLGQYYQTDSLLHRLDPRIKLTGTLVFIISLFIANSFTGYLIAAVFLITMIRLSNVPFSYIIRGMRAILFILFITMAFNLFLTPGEVLVKFGIFKITREGVYFAGQMTGVEGYIESTSSGFVAGINAAYLALGKEAVIFPKETEIGALAHYVSEGGVSSSFQPMNANFGIIAPFDKKIKGGKRNRNEAYAERSLEIIKALSDSLN
jgi:tRNA:m(5)U-54 methyltransferase